MGISISHMLCCEAPHLKGILDRAEAQAREYKAQGLPVEVARRTATCLYINVGECETLAFDFLTPRQIENRRKKTGWAYVWSVLTDEGKRELDPGYEIKRFPQNRRLYAAAFCKTQFADSAAEHMLVAELLRTVASRCRSAEVSDDGDYYYSGNVFDAAEAIAECGKLINSIGATLADSGFEVITGARIGEIGQQPPLPGLDDFRAQYEAEHGEAAA